MHIYSQLFERNRRAGQPVIHAAANALRDRSQIYRLDMQARILKQTVWIPPSSSDWDPRPACVFSHFDPANQVAGYVRHYLRALREVASTTVFVTTSEQMEDPTIASLRDLADAVIVRTNIGYDFCSWRAGIALLGEAAGSRGLILANDSMYGPFGSLIPLFETMHSREADLWGLLDSFEEEPHLHSYFLVFSAKAARAPWFADFWRSMVHLPNRWKSLVVSEYEIGLSGAAQRAGCKIASLYSIEEIVGRHGARRPDLALEDVNGALHFWKELIGVHGFPFLKKSLLANKDPGLSYIKLMRRLVSDRGYDLELIDAHLEASKRR